MSALITAERATEIAQGIADKAAADFQRGMLDCFARGQYQGMFCVVMVHMGLPTNIADRIEAELDNLCNLARKAGQ